MRVHVFVSLFAENREVELYEINFASPLGKLYLACYCYESINNNVAGSSACTKPFKQLWLYTRYF